MSESFADCQDFIQLQEQQFFRLKLKHALDLKVALITRLLVFPQILELSSMKLNPLYEVPSCISSV